MAVDSAEKRMSTLGLCHWHPIIPVADGTTDQGDRQQLLGIYRGILAGAPEELGVSSFRRLRRMSDSLGRGEYL